MPQPSTTVAANDAASSNDVCRINAAGGNDRANDGPLNSHRPPQNPLGKDWLLAVGCWLRRELVRTFVAVSCERALLAKSVASALSGSARPHRD